MNCPVESCEKPATTKGLCDKHYRRQKAHGDPLVTLRLPRQRGLTCGVRERGKKCRNPAVARDLCRKHYSRLQRYGDPLVTSRRSPGDPLLRCSVKTCKRASRSKGLCTLHYTRLRYYGDPLIVPQRRQPVKLQPHYSRWCAMKARCYRPTAKNYSIYGGRGIKVCRKWHKFPAFRDYLVNVLGDPPEGYTLDRIDPDGNYEPGNVRWASATEQRHNRRDAWNVPLVNDGDIWGDPDSCYGCSVCGQAFKSLSAFDRHHCAKGQA